MALTSMSMLVPAIHGWSCPYAHVSPLSSMQIAKAGQVLTCDGFSMKPGRNTNFE